jgi:hypothetical protein
MVAGVFTSQFWTYIVQWVDRLAGHVPVPGETAGHLGTLLARNLNETKLVTTVLINLVLVIVLSLIWPGRHDEPADVRSAE